jgi:hypothetical protein
MSPIQDKAQAEWVQHFLVKGYSIIMDRFAGRKSKNRNIFLIMVQTLEYRLFYMVQQPIVGQGLLIVVLHYHTEWNKLA